MPTVEPLHIAMIEKTLRDLYGKALTDNEHQVCEVRFEYEERFGCSMIYEVGAGGDEHTILQMYCYTNRRFAPPAFEGVRDFCNDWNTNTRWPRAYFVVTPPAEDDDDGEAIGRVILDYHLPVQEGIHQEFVDSLYVVFYRGCCRFWEEFHELEGSPPAVTALPQADEIATVG